MAGTGLGAAGAVRPGASMALWPRTAIRDRRLAPGPGLPVGRSGCAACGRGVVGSDPEAATGRRLDVRRPGGLVAAVGRFGAFAFATGFGADAFAADAFGADAFVGAVFAAGAFAADDFGADAFAALPFGFGAGTSPASRGLRARRCGCGSPSP